MKHVGICQTYAFFAQILLCYTCQFLSLRSISILNAVSCPLITDYATSAIFS